MHNSPTLSNPFQIKLSQVGIRPASFPTEKHARAMLSQGEPRDAAVNFDSFQQHRTVFTVIVMLKNWHNLLSSFGIRIIYVLHFQSQYTWQLGSGPESDIEITLVPKRLYRNGLPCSS